MLTLKHPLHARVEDASSGDAVMLTLKQPVCVMSVGAASGVKHELHCRSWTCCDEWRMLTLKQPVCVMSVGAAMGAASGVKHEFALSLVDML
eukprot:1161326-Pelagomonas_calceolata.AAC.2